MKEVVEFAKGIPGFQELSQYDQVMLLKSGTFQVMEPFALIIPSSLGFSKILNFIAFHSITGSDGEVLHFVQC